MGKERRRDERYEVHQDVYMLLDESSILCHIENISRAGAYMQVDEEYQGMVLKNSIGSDVELVFDSGDPEQQNITGKILRSANENNAVFFAVYFMQEYRFRQ